MFVELAAEASSLSLPQESATETNNSENRIYQASNEKEEKDSKNVNQVK